MKSLAELEAIKNRAKEQLNVRTNDSAKKILVGMATCGIAAGARPVLQAFVEEVAKRGLDDVVVSQTGCIGVCRHEPLVEVFIPGQEKVTYVNIHPEMVGRIVSEHIVNGNIVKEYTIGFSEENNK